MDTFLDIRATRLVEETFRAVDIGYVGAMHALVRPVPKMFKNHANIQHKLPI